MGGIFDFSLWDVINHPILKMTGKLVKFGGKAAISAVEKAKSRGMTTSELAELTNDAHAGNSNAQLLLAFHYTKENDADEVIHWLLRSARNGNEHALGILEMLQEG